MGSKPSKPHHQPPAAPPNGRPDTQQRQRPLPHLPPTTNSQPAPPAPPLKTLHQQTMATLKTPFSPPHPECYVYRGDEGVGLSRGDGDGDGNGKGEVEVGNGNGNGDGGLSELIGDLGNGNGSHGDIGKGEQKEIKRKPVEKSAMQDYWERQRREERCLEDRWRRGEG